MKAGSDHPVPDELLVGYIDSTLDAAEMDRVARALRESTALRERHAFLAAGSRSFRDAFAPLLDTVPASLNARIDIMVSAKRRGSLPRWPVDRRAAITAIAGAAGAVIFGYWLGNVSPPSPAIDLTNWREAVAQYHRFYSPKTLALISGQASTADKELAFVGGELGLPLSPPSLAVPGLIYRRAQLLQFDDAPLAQIVYEGPDSVVVAYCIRRIPAADALPEPERRAGLNVVHWLKDGFGYMLVSELDQAGLLQIASVLAARA